MINFCVSVISIYSVTVGLALKHLKSHVTLHKQDSNQFQPTQLFSLDKREYWYRINSQVRFLGVILVSAAIMSTESYPDLYKKFYHINLKITIYT